MASSTEEVSTGQENAAGAAAERYIDDMTSSEKQFAVFKDFDFLEYELESQEVSSSLVVRNVMKIKYSIVIN